MTGLLFISEILTLSIFLSFQYLNPQLREEGLWPAMLWLILTVLLTGLFLFGAGRMYIRHLATKTSLQASRLTKPVIESFSPLLPLALVCVSPFVFLKDVRPLMLPFALAGIITLQASFLRRVKRSCGDKKFFFESWQCVRRFLSSRWLVPVAVFLVPFCIYTLLASGLIFPAHPFTGDEPHYLLITQSILHDGDINLFNNYESRDYFRYYSGALDPHAYEGKKGAGYLFSKHLPGLAVILMPAYALGEAAGIRDGRLFIFAVRLTICLFTAFLSGIFFLMVNDVVKRRRASFLAWLIFSFLSPVIFYSHLLYPEVLAALISLLIFRLMIYRKEASLPTCLLSGIGAGALPWLGIKYAALSILIVAVVIFPRLKSPRENTGKIFTFVFPCTVSAGFILFYLWSLYGNFSPLSIYSGAFPDARTGLSSFFPPGFSGIVQSALGYLLDQRIGVFVFAPVYILCIAGAFLATKHIGKSMKPLLFLFVTYWIYCSLFPYWVGFCPPGRQLLCALWIPALLLAAVFAENRNGFGHALTASGIGLSAMITFFGIRNPWLLYQADLADTRTTQGAYGPLVSSLSGAVIDLRKSVPLLVGREGIQWFPLTAWVCAIALLAFGMVKFARTGRGAPPYDRLELSASVVVSVSILVLGFLSFNIRLDNISAFDGKGYELIFQDENQYGKEMGGFWTKGNRKCSLFVGSPEPLSEIMVTLSSPLRGRARLQVGRFICTAARRGEMDLKRTIHVSSPQGIRWKGRFLYYVNVRENTSFVPSEHTASSRDKRPLGVFVEIEVIKKSPSSS